jgi:hypothetical protein
VAPNGRGAAGGEQGAGLVLAQRAPRHAARLCAGRAGAGVGAVYAAGQPRQPELQVRHKAIIDSFGRYPHRNAILGRSSSARELAFLSQPGSSFQRRTGKFATVLLAARAYSMGAGDRFFLQIL